MPILELREADDAAIPAAGYAVRALSDRMTIKLAESLSQAMRSRAPLASSLSRFEERAAVYHASRDPKALAALAIAARALALNLKDAGVSIRTSDLVRGVSVFPKQPSNQPG